MSKKGISEISYPVTILHFFPQYILFRSHFLSEKFSFVIFIFEPWISFSHVQPLLCTLFISVHFVYASLLSFVFPIQSLSGAQHWLSCCSSPSSHPSFRYQSSPNASLLTRPPSRPPSRPSRPPSHPSVHGSPAPLSTLPKHLSLEGTRNT